jgi:prepilin-type N-terminal cleavage/methylation domain-containing protein
VHVQSVWIGWGAFMSFVDRTPDCGFTLIEVLVAMAVTAIFLVLLLPISISSLGRAELSAKKNRAWFLAKSQLAGVAPCRGAGNGLLTGREATLRWELRIGGADNQAPDKENAETGLSLRTIRVIVSEVGANLPLVDISVRRLCSKP